MTKYLMFYNIGMLYSILVNMVFMAGSPFSIFGFDNIFPCCIFFGDDVFYYTLDIPNGDPNV